MSSETITRNDLTNILNQVLSPSSVLADIRKSSATISGSTATIALDNGFNKTNTLVIGMEVKNSDGSVSNVMGFANLLQFRWTSAGTGIYVLLGDTSFNNGTATVYYIMWGSNTSNTDYIIEQGTSGIWTYRKWASGVAECWGSYQEPSASAFTGTGYIYYRAVGSFAFPSGLFVSTPYVFANGYHGNVGGCVAYSPTSANVSISAWSALSTARAVTVYMYAKGSWK